MKAPDQGGPNDLRMVVTLAALTVVALGLELSAAALVPAAPVQIKRNLVEELRQVLEELEEPEICFLEEWALVAALGPAVALMGTLKATSSRPLLQEGSLALATGFLPAWAQTAL